MVKTMCSKEIEIKNGLEKILRACVDDVKSEIAKKRSENKSIYCKQCVANLVYRFQGQERSI